MTENNNYLSTRDVADKLGISVTCLLNLEKKGSLKPYIRLPTGKRLYLESEVDEFIKEISKKEDE